MTPENFAYWLQGFAELNDKPPTQQQWDSIRAHIALVFKKETPPFPPFRLSESKDSIAQEAIRRFNEQQAREKMGRLVDPSYWQTPVITC
jgi:hypothetical protein